MDNASELKLYSCYDADFIGDTEELLCSEEFLDLKESLVEYGIDLEGSIVASMVENEFQVLAATIVTKDCVVFSVVWDLSESNLADGLVVKNVTGSRGYYDLWPQTHLAVSRQNMAKYQ